MKVQLRIYKRWDLDLLCLFCMGYNVKELAEKALYAYVHKEKLSILIDTNEFFDAKELHSIHTAIFCDDPAVCSFLQNIKPGCRSACIKQILRGALCMPQVSAYLKNGDYFATLNEEAASVIHNDPSVYIPTRTENRAVILAAFERAATADNKAGEAVEPAKTEDINIPIGISPDMFNV